jgi:predicted PurR-regulated permease PerM
MSERKYHYPSYSTILVTLMLITILAASVVIASEVLMILFLGILFGILLTKLRDAIVAKTGFNAGVALTLVVALLLLLLAIGGMIFTVQINSQMDRIAEQLDRSAKELTKLVDRYPVAEAVLNSVPLVSAAIDLGHHQVQRSSGDAEQTSSKRKTDAAESDPDGENFVPEQDGTNGGETKARADSTTEGKGNAPSNPSTGEPFEKLTSAITGLFQTTFGLVINSLLIFFVGLFLASSPQTYVTSTVCLFPPPYRPRAKQVLAELGHTLWRWLLGRFATMTITGFGAFLVLFLVGVKMATTIGIITALLCFIPNIGAAIAFLLAMLATLPQGFTAVVTVAIGYVALQLVESYIITPLIQQRQVSLPPAVLLAFQAFLGALLGFIGTLIASPLLAALSVATKMLYVEDYLGDHPSED